MAGISIALSSFNDFTSVNVEGLGVIKVCKESSNQGLRHSENIRDIFNLQNDVAKLEKRIKKLLSEGKTSDDEEIMKLEQKGTDNLVRITDIRKQEQVLCRARLSDDEEGKLVEELFNRASDEDISKLLAAGDITDTNESEDKEKDE